MKTNLLSIATIFVSSVFISPVFMRTAKAHFPWLMTDDQGNASYFFGETPADRQYKMPESVAKATVGIVGEQGQIQPIDLNATETDDFIGMQSTTPVAGNASLTSKVTYGVYHGSRLDYYSQHFAGRLPTNKQQLPVIGDGLALHAALVDTDQGVDVFIRWNGEPLADAEVQLFCSAGHQEGSATTDSQGMVSFNDHEVEDGLNGLLVGHTSDGESGTFNSQAYQSVSHYLTATFIDPQDFESAPGTSVSVTSDRFPPIPQTVTSFGAAIADNALYVYGGHMGEAHQYYMEAQAHTLRRLDLSNPVSWEELGNGPRLQGLAMVAHDTKLYRMGGFTAKNSEGEDKDLWSQADVASFDTSTREWEDLPALPEPRSSFDAVVLDDQIFVVGGWAMKGDGDATWLETAHCLDLSAQPLQWKSLPKPPFQRRALSVAALDGKIYAIGGMQQEGGPTTRVDVFDTQSQSWSRGPDLTGEGMDGFGSSSFATGGRLYATTYDGTLQRLNNDGDRWEVLHELERERFFHRLLPINETQLLTVGGANMSIGKFEELDVIEVK